MICGFLAENSLGFQGTQGPDKKCYWYSWHEKLNTFRVRTFLKAGLSSLSRWRQLSRSLLRALGVSVRSFSIAGLRKPHPTMNKIWKVWRVYENSASPAAIWLYAHLVLIANMIVGQRARHQLVQNNSCNGEHHHHISALLLLEIVDTHQMHRRQTEMCTGHHRSSWWPLVPSREYCQ